MAKKKTNKGGRPNKYTSVEEMKKKIDEYFNSCYRYYRDKQGNLVVDPLTKIPIKEQYKPFTISGLADALDMTRQSLLNYTEKEEFFDTIMRAKRKCEVYTEERLFDKDGNKGAIFSLTNNYDNWKNKQDIGGIVGVGSIEDYLKKVEDEEEY